MSDLGDLIAPEAILPRVIATSRRHALQALCETLARTAGVNERSVFDAILLRERNKGTGVGDGVAIPHAHAAGLSKPVAAFARLDPAQDFEANDGRPADLVVMLLTPPERSGDHLKALARISRLLRRADMREKLRAARSVDELYALIADAVRSDAA